METTVQVCKYGKYIPYAVSWFLATSILNILNLQRHLLLAKDEALKERGIQLMRLCLDRAGTCRKLFANCRSAWCVFFLFVFGWVLEFSNLGLN